MIELFKEPNIDWMGKAKYFYALSGILLIAGWVSIIMHGGLRYSIDFKGGTNVDVRFAQPPNLDHLRGALSAQGLGNTEIQSIGDIGGGKSDEVLIFVPQEASTDEARDSSKARVLAALDATYNLASPPMRRHLRSPFAARKSSAPKLAPNFAARQFSLPSML